MSRLTECKVCKGHGQEPTPCGDCSSYSIYDYSGNCFSCFNEGETYDGGECRTCGGSGEVADEVEA